MILCNYVALSLPIDDYLEKPEAVYNWTKYAESITPNGGRAHYLNVTSLTWLDTTFA